MRSLIDTDKDTNKNQETEKLKAEEKALAEKLATEKAAAEKQKSEESKKTEETLPDNIATIDASIGLMIKEQKGGKE